MFKRLPSWLSKSSRLTSLALASLTLALSGCPAPAGGTTGPVPPPPPSSSAETTTTATDTPQQPPPPARPAPEPYPVPDELAALVDAPDRSAADRALDGGRHPAETLAFFGIKPGMRVAELGAGSGYTSELLARAVGKDGVVYGQNTPFILERFAEEPWSERLKKDVNKVIVRVDREFEDPFPADVKDLDAVLVILFYHDTYWMETDRLAMNKAVHRALKPNGIYGIVDHSAAAGAGDTEVKTLHRIEEKTLVEDVVKAGFKLADEASFLRNPQDPQDWSAAPSAAGFRRGTSDRFVLKFMKN